jgi:hypothetical protein
MAFFMQTNGLRCPSDSSKQLLGLLFLSADSSCKFRPKCTASLSRSPQSVELPPLGHFEMIWPFLTR